MATVFSEAGSSATGGTEFWTTVSGTCVSDTTVTKTPPRSIKCTSSGAGAPANISKQVLANAGRRFTMYWQQDLPTADLIIWTNGSGTGLSVVVTSGGAFKICTNSGATCTSASATTVSAMTPTAFTLSYVITTTTNWSAKLYLNRALVISASNADFSLLGTSGLTTLTLGWFSTAVGNSKNFYISDVYVDDGTDTLDPGDLRVTAKFPTADNVGNFTASFGVAAPSSRYTNVDDRPLDATNGWVNTTTTANAENYTLEAASVGDVDLTGATIVARTAWVYAANRAASGLSTFLPATASCTVTANGNTGCTTGAMNFMTGQTVICALAENGAGAAEAISDTGGNTWTNITTGTSTVKQTSWYAVVGAGTKAGSQTVSFSATSGNIKRAGICAAFDGLDTTTPLDVNPLPTSDGTSPYTGPASGTLAQTNEMLVGIFAWAGPVGDTTACSTNTTTDAVTEGTTGGGATSNANIRLCYDMKTATTTLSPNATNTTSNRAGIQTTTSWKVRSNATPGVGTPKITNNGVDTAIVLGAALTLYTDTVDSATYPSNAAGIGMVASGATASTVLYEAGMLIAYLPAAVVDPFPLLPRVPRNVTPLRM